MYINIKDTNKVPVVHVIKVYWGSRNTAPFILKLGSRWRRVVNFNPPAALPYFLTVWREKISCLFQESKAKHVNVYPCYLEVINLYQIYCRSQWPRGLRRRSTAARLLRSWFRISPGAWMFVCCVCVVCWQVEVSATSWLLVQRSPTDCGAWLCVIKKPRERGGHSPRWAAVPEK
jgi:hypothetical protein